MLQVIFIFKFCSETLQLSNTFLQVFLFIHFFAHKNIDIPVDRTNMNFLWVQFGFRNHAPIPTLKCRFHQLKTAKLHRQIPLKRTKIALSQRNNHYIWVHFLPKEVFLWQHPSEKGAPTVVIWRRLNGEDSEGISDTSAKIAAFVSHRAESM